jgi:hypothetical protein
LKKEYQSLKTRLMYYNMQMKIKGKNTKDVWMEHAGPLKNQIYEVWE